MVNHRSLEDCLASLRRLAAAGLPPRRTIIVDSGSADASLERLAAEAPACRLLGLPENRGFAVAANRGLALAWEEGASAVLLLNPDTRFEPRGFLDALLAGLDASADGRSLAEACHAPEIFRLDRPERAWFSGAWSRGSRQVRRPAGDARTAVDVVWATCLLLGRDTWRRVGPFDEAYFLFYEDLDWCRRARSLGLRPRIQPGARIWHAVGGSMGGEASPLRQLHMARSGLRYHAASGPTALFAQGLRLSARALLWLGRRRPAAALALLRGMAQAWPEAWAIARARRDGGRDLAARW